MATTTPVQPQAPGTCWLSCPFEPDTTLELHEQLDTVDPADWDRLVAGRGLYMQRRFLEALDRGTEQVLYLAFERQGRRIGVARFERATFSGPGVLPLLDEDSWARLAARSVGLDQPVATTAWVCGSAFTGGEHGFAFEEGVEPEEAVRLLRRALAVVQREERAANLIFKEFVGGEQAQHLAKLGCAEMQGGARMVLELDPAWTSFQDYLGSLRSKFRVKARRADSLSSALEVRELGLEELWQCQERMQELLDQVCDKADYQLGCASVSALVQLRSALGPGEMRLQGYFLEGELVGFLSAFKLGEDCLDAHLVGIDYAHNRQHGVYPRMLVDFLRLGLELGVRRVDYGRTAEEIKSSLGARPVPTRVYLKHTSPWLNPLVKVVAKAVEPATPKLKLPFKGA